MIQCEQFLFGNHRNFIYLLSEGQKCFVVDCHLPDEIFKIIESRNQKALGILLTHTHWDHVYGLEKFLHTRLELPIYVHPGDAFRLKNISKGLLRFVQDKDRIALGSSSIEVLHTPGHSQGAVCYLIPHRPPIILTGDTVFVGNVGRTDLETGSSEALFATIQKIKTFPPNTILLPGHDYGPATQTTLAREMQYSAAFQCKTAHELDLLP